MTIPEMKLKRGQLGTEAHKILTTVGCTSEQRAVAQKMLDEADALTVQIDLTERAAKIESESREIVRVPRPGVGAGDGEGATDDDAAARAYRNAFEVYTRFGMGELKPEERAILGRGVRSNGANARSIMVGGEKRDITVAGTGNYIVPQEFYNELISAKKFIGALTANVKRKTTAGNGAPMKIGFENDTANTIIVVAEDTTVTEADPTLSGVIAQTDTLATLIKVSRQELADSAFDLTALFRDRLGKRYARGLENFIANGDTSNIASLIGSITTYTTTAANTGPTYADFVACETQLDVAYEPNAAWYFSKATRNYVMGLLDTLNRPLFLPNPQTGMLDQILGYPIKLSAYIPNANVATNFGVVFGDLNEGYLLRDDGEMTVQRLDERYADQLMVGFLAYTRVGGNYLDAGTHPIVGMKTHA